MIELPGWNDLISVNGFCYSSSMGESPKLNIPLKTSVAPTKGIAPATFVRNSTATYIDSAGLVQTAGINVPRFQNGRYLCEPAATNRFLQSGTPATQVITVVSGTIYTVQCYGSGSITLSGAGTGVVVQGTPVTFTASSTSLTCTVSGSLNRAQVETGTKATSYIPTTTVPMDRVADALHYTVGSVITQGQGSLYCEFYFLQSIPNNRRLLFLSNNSLSDNLIMYIDSSTKIRFVGKTDNITNIGNIAITSLSVGNNKCILTYKDNDINIYLNGALAGSDNSGLISKEFTKLYIGVGPDNLGQANTTIGNIKYYKEVLTEAESIELTTV